MSISPNFFKLLKVAIMGRKLRDAVRLNREAADRLDAAVKEVLGK